MTAAFHSGPAFYPIHWSHTPVVANDNKKWGRGHYRGNGSSDHHNSSLPPPLCVCVCDGSRVRSFNPSPTPGSYVAGHEGLKVCRIRLLLGAVTGSRTAVVAKQNLYSGYHDTPSLPSSRWRLVPSLKCGMFLTLSLPPLPSSTHVHIRMNTSKYYG